MLPSFLRPVSYVTHTNNTKNLLHILPFKGLNKHKIIKRQQFQKLGQEFWARLMNLSKLTRFTQSIQNENFK